MVNEHKHFGRTSSKQHGLEASSNSCGQALLWWRALSQTACLHPSTPLLLLEQSCMVKVSVHFAKILASQHQCCTLNHTASLLRRAPPGAPVEHRVVPQAGLWGKHEPEVPSLLHRGHAAVCKVGGNMCTAVLVAVWSAWQDSDPSWGYSPAAP
jgi:hypothetical protein